MSDFFSTVFTYIHSNSSGIRSKLVYVYNNNNNNPELVSYTSAMAQQGKCFEFQFVLILSEYFARHNSQHEKTGRIGYKQKGNLTRIKK